MEGREIEDKIIIYTQPGCGRCSVLKKKMTEAGIAFTENGDRDEMESLGITSTPMVSMGGNLLTFNDAIAWLRNNPGSKE